MNQVAHLIDADSMEAGWYQDRAATPEVLPARVGEWKIWQYAQSLSARTVDERIATVLRCSAWAHTDAEHLRPDQISAWLAEDDWSDNTRWTYHTSLASWFRWLQQMEYRVINPMDKVGRPRRPRGTPRPLSDDNIRRLLRTPMRRRSRAMILLAAMQGFRAHEIAKIKGEHLDLVERTVIVTGKGGYTATLPLHHMVVEIAYQMPRKGYWFPGVDRGHQRRESVCGTIKEVMLRANVPGSAHGLRHWFGTALVRAGVDLRTVQTLMRHQNLAQTALYTEISRKQQMNGIQLLDPFGVANTAAALTTEQPPGRPEKSAVEQPPSPKVNIDDLRRQAAELLAAAERLERLAAQG